MLRKPLVVVFLAAIVTGGLSAQSAPPPPVSASQTPSGSWSGSRSTGTGTGSLSPSPSRAFYPQADASFSGAFTWNYPIELPPGTGGMKPNLSLSYNSFAPNGVLGVGFVLSGLSVIERDPSRGAIEFDSTDTYMLDGKKLYWQNSDSQFHTERETYDRIQAFTVSGGPTTATANPNAYDSYWVVSKKDGTKLFYGAIDNDSPVTHGRISAVGKTDEQGRPLTRVWALNKAIDALGNYYVIEYQQNSVGAYYPLSITYTKNDGSNPISTWKKIQFSYESRTDRGPMFSPTKVDLDRRLKWISVLAGVEASQDGQLIAKYRLDYQYGASTGRSQL